ncbi:hypothetical protein ASG01_10185 [Chryseobacterium sp. Leaf180]|uniref:septal ring lytic transglycosylase RlpA family protein n=1 Tax=Chryseobacterium sp. Leaf180 TaxID=1736289 RepID=UPI0006FF172B|nr:septal ring lytic transglycosylase RlpA family protein [Chryseobacterium sp. Leaf180]KQR93533.1 hypothetical protein ASG01_10185 [Chryseobacterium sp. Leaf180]
MLKNFTLVLVTAILSLATYSFADHNVADAKTSYASYYHSKFNGRKTASGEIFDNNKLTAAHRSLPFGTEIKITNLKNGKEVIVEVNDRGPFHSSRVLDMSRAAFAAIANPSEGKVPVSFEVITDDEN